MAPIDPLTLEAQEVSLHQLATFLKEDRSLGNAVEESPLFVTTREGSVVRAEWIAATPDEALPYPLGRLTLHEGGILLEGFSETRIAQLRRHVDQLGSLRLTDDQTRAFRLEELLAHPARAMHPFEEAAGVEPTARDLARWYLRAAWPYQPCEELDGRTPSAAIGTGRGRARIEDLLEALGPKLSQRFAGFPSFDEDELRGLLLAKPPVAAPDRPEHDPSPPSRHSPRRA